MNQLSMFDLPAASAHGYDGSSFWWTLKYKPMYEKAVAEFFQMYDVGPVFHLSWPRRQAFLVDPGQSVIIDRASGRLTAQDWRKLWEVDYREVKAFRPQDLAPQICSTLSGAASREAWRPMVMSEIIVPESEVETLLARLEHAGAFVLHWPAFQDKHALRMFGDPALLESLRYR